MLGGLYTFTSVKLLLSAPCIVTPSKCFEPPGRCYIASAGTDLWMYIHNICVCLSDWQGGGVYNWLAYASWGELGEGECMGLPKALVVREWNCGRGGRSNNVISFEMWQFNCKKYKPSGGRPSTNP